MDSDLEATPATSATSSELWMDFGENFNGCIRNAEGNDLDLDEHVTGEIIDDASDLVELDDDSDDIFEEVSLQPAVESPPFPELVKTLDTMDQHLCQSAAADADVPALPPSGASSPPFCRICRDPDPEPHGQRLPVQPSQQTLPLPLPLLLVSPCLCRGSVAQVHVACLERWLAESDSTCCELCGCQYQTVRTPRYNVLTSIPTWAFTAGGSELLVDILALAVFTPAALIGTYLGINSTDDSVYIQMSLMTAIDMVYSAWLLMRFHYHFTRWHSWWRRKFTVKLILDKSHSKQSFHSLM